MRHISNTMSATTWENGTMSDVTTALFLGKNFRVKSHDDATWILSSAFVVFTMQSGFGLLESGSVSSKNEVNIMVKNAVDVICGGLTYWMFGYGLSFGEDERYTNPFNGWGDFFVTADEESLGYVYSKFFFQASFATTATTIVSGAMAERTKLEAYIIFSLLNTFVYCFPAHWFWGKQGWLQTMGVIDIAGAGPVHLVGGVTGLVSTLLLKPRHNRFKSKKAPQMGSPTNAMLGMFMLWWGWLGFNCGSTFGISGLKWKLAARSAVSTICASTSGGIVGLLLSYIVKKRQFDVGYLINSILGSLVAITATCAIAHPWEGLLIGVVGACLTILGIIVLEKLKIDDPVGCVGVHAVGGVWSLLAAGFLSRKDSFASELQLHNVHDGVLAGGGFHQLGIQTLAVVVLIGWSFVTSFIFLKIIDMVIGLRVPLCEEILGADMIEHGIGEATYDKKTKKVVYDDEEDFLVGRASGQRTHSLGKHTDQCYKRYQAHYQMHKRRLLKRFHFYMKGRLWKTHKLDPDDKPCDQGQAYSNDSDGVPRAIGDQYDGFLYEDFGHSDSKMNGRFHYNTPRQESDMNCYSMWIDGPRETQRDKRTEGTPQALHSDHAVRSKMPEMTYI
ncbi:putative ammonium transporter 2 [Haliotis rufescens]|uniref:putative ammonium transporter 2 n=1 Tax=Haliotis rufescens TaxID=6454 RepID=UPI00201F9FA4|nr:putative ammonium transporter 2 [Haliotis rufescens]